MKSVSWAAIEGRVDELLTIMNLQHCRNRKIDEYPNERGRIGGELRRLSIAVEIITLPPLIIIENPTLALGPTVAVSIYECLQKLSKEGYAVLVVMPKPHQEVFGFIDHLVVLVEGVSIFSSSPKNIEPFYCTPEMGYFLKRDGYVGDFVMNIAQGVERSTVQRVADPPAVLQEKFEESLYFVRPHKSPAMLRALPTTTFLNAYFSTFNSAGCCATDYFKALVVYFLRLFTIIERGIAVKLRETEVLKRSFFSSALVGTIGGYLQFNQGDYGYYTVTILGLPYLGTANCTGVMFFARYRNFSLIAQQQCLCHDTQIGTRFRWKTESFDNCKIYTILNKIWTNHHQHLLFR